MAPILCQQDLVAYFKLKLDFKELTLIESVFEHRAHQSY